MSAPICAECRFYTRRGLIGPGCGRTAVPHVDIIGGYESLKMESCQHERAFNREHGFFGKRLCGPAGRYYEAAK